MLKVNTQTKKNPTNKEFLKTIFIEKDYGDLHHTAEYFIYRNEDNSKRDRFGTIPRAFAIAHAYYNTKDKWIYDLAVNPNYQRKGLATHLYDYIEKDQKIKLKPSDYLLEPGKVFWKNRLKNPRNDELLSKIKIKKRITNNGFTYDVLYEDNSIAYVEIAKNKNNIHWIEIAAKYQRKGLATYLYNYIERDLKIKLNPSDCLLAEGKAFWKAR
jgi:GNAT superfamily N-acetyltransferase